MSGPARPDVVVVGGGIAGLVAANRALELGRSVVVLEAQTDAKYPCATRMSGGAFHVMFRNVDVPPDELYRTIVDGCDGHADLALARAIADHAARSVAWLATAGATFAKLTPDRGWTDTVLAPHGFQESTKLRWEGLGSDVLLERLEARLAVRGGRLVRGQRARKLIVEDGRCAGVIASGAGRDTAWHAGAVVLADGSFHGSRALLRQYVTAHPEHLLFRGPATGLGDGIAMGESVGAALVSMEYFYGHLLSADALHNEDLVLFPFIDLLAAGGVLVDDQGRRFADEGGDGRYMANLLAQTPTAIGTAIFDAPVWDRQGREFHSPPNPNLVAQGGTIHQADDLETLARRAGLPVAAVVRTVAEYNAALAAGTLGRLTPPRTTRRLAACPIATPPYYAVPTCAAITHAFGGLAIDASARVLRADRTAIPGLYAAGAVCGGIDGGPGAAYVGGLVIGAVFGLLAAETIAAQRA